MVFWNRGDDDLPEELRGKKPEEIAAALKTAKTLEDAKAAADAAKTAAETALAAKNTEFEQMKTRMATLEANQRMTPEEEAAAAAAAAAAEPASPWVDPQKFVQQETARTSAVALAAGIMSAKMYFQQGLTPRDQKIFRKYEKEVETTVSTFVPEQRVMPQSWMNAFLYVKGGHEQEISKAETTNTDFFSETPTRSGAPPSEESTDKLTPEEEEVCRKFHYDPKTYLERRKSGTLAASDKGQYSRYPVPMRSNS